MGKWTPHHYDDVLSSKIRILVTGAIQRSKLEKPEKTEPSISYEAFVEDLDVGDSFTTSIVEILVKEMADRRTRLSSGDRRLIADRTAKNIRMLATPLHIYRDRSGGRNALARRPANLTEYLTAPPDEMDMEEDDEEFDSMLDNAANPSEGARFNPELYDAYRGNHWSSFEAVRRPHSTYSAVSGSEDAPAVIPISAPSPPTTSRNGTWSLPPSLPGTSNISRHPSIRRTIRARTVDFNDFTSRRRSTIRQTEARSDNEPRAVSPVFRELSPVRDMTRSSQSARRFFPFSRNRRSEATGSFSWSGESEPTVDVNEEGPYLTPESTWFSLPTPMTSTSSLQHESSDDAGRSGERSQAMHRLRRGGLRAPESMLSRHASPAPVTIIETPVSPISDSGHRRGDTLPTYPTPSSTESENSADTES